MGKFLSCLRIEQLPQHDHQCRCSNSSVYLKRLCHCRSLCTSNSADQANCKGASESIACTLPENYSNFNTLDFTNNISKNSVITMPEKRSFYSRIPPFSKSSGVDGRRSASRECSEAKIRVLFQYYKDPDLDAILADGIIKMCADLEVKPDDFKILLFAWKCEAETMCQFTKEEFLHGCKLLNCDSVRAIQSKFPELLMEAQDSERFKELYRFSFNFALDTEAGQRILSLDLAISLWKLVFSQREPPILTRWVRFLERHPSIRGISKDTWCMFLNFIETVADDLSLYDDTEAWPSLLDDFVEYENDHLNQNISEEEKEEM